MRRGVWILVIVIVGWSVWYNHPSAPFLWAADPTTPTGNTPNGHLSNGNSRDPYLSVNGRVVVFASEATNLSGNDTNGMTDIFVWETVR